MNVLAARLRAETRTAHDAIEAAVGFEARVANRAAYRRWLERLYGFHRVWEPLVAEALDEPSFLTPRLKLPLLADDLDRMGVSAPDALPAPDWSPFASRGEAIGSLYVVEGSTLGGQVIAKRVRAVLGFKAVYHASYGRRSAAMWRGFQARLADVAVVEHDAVVAGADMTFVRLRDWLTG